MKPSILLSVAFLLLALPPLAGWGAEDELPSPFDASLSPTERLEALEQRMRLAHDTLETLHAGFTQTKQSALLIEPEQSEGEFFYAAPDRIRWEYLRPEHISLVVADRVMTTWYRDMGQVEKARVGEQSDRVFRYLGAGASLDALVKYFRVTLHLPPSRLDPLWLELTPRFERVAKRIQRLDLWLDPSLYLPVRLKFVEGDGDVTEYAFQNLRRNEGIPAERFELELPRDAQVREVFLDGSAGTGEPR